MNRHGIVWRRLRALVTVTISVGGCAVAPVHKPATSLTTGEPTQPVNCAATARPTWGRPDSTLLGTQRDSRRNAVSPRPRAQVIAELQGLERLRRTLSDDSPDWTQLLRRLAEGYVELESASVHDVGSAEDPTIAAKIVREGQYGAIQHYDSLLSGSRSYARRDEVMYYLGYEYEKVEDYDHALLLYQRLIRETPESPFVPFAYLGAGELLFREAESNPSTQKWKRARAAYDEFAKYPPIPQGSWFAYGQYKLGYIGLFTGDARGARDSFERAAQHAKSISDPESAVRLAEASRKLVAALDVALRSPCGP